MRTAFRRRSREDEEESVFVSMTDMTVSFLFILMILLAFFASLAAPEDSISRLEHDQVVAQRDKLITQLAQAWREIEELKAEIVELKAKLEEQDPLERYLAQTSEVRKRILEQLRDQLQAEFPELQVALSEENDALRFQGDGLFESSQFLLRADKRAIVASIASGLEQLLPCYTLGPSSRWSSQCNEAGAIIEAVQIEGHTDSSGDDLNNLKLSTARANETFDAMITREKNLIQHKNWRDQPVLSVAGYGEMRPVTTNDSEGARATNRRIDLRIIMYTPTISDEIEKIRQQLGATPTETVP